MELKVNYFENTNSIEVRDDERCVARSCGNILFIDDSTDNDTAIFIAEHYGYAFGVVFYRNYDAWLPAVEVATDWAC